MTHQTRTLFFLGVWLLVGIARGFQQYPTTTFHHHHHCAALFQYCSNANSKTITPAPRWTPHSDDEYHSNNNNLRLPSRLLGEASSEDKNDAGTTQDDDADDETTAAVSPDVLDASGQQIVAGEPSLWQRVKNAVGLGGNTDNDGLTFRQKMAKMGLSVMLSYGWVSNMSYCVTLSIAWYIFSKQTGLSPLAPGQWKKFLAVYGGFYIFNNLIRPLRVAASVAVSPYFDKLVNQVQQKLQLQRKATAVTLTVLVVNLFGTTALMCAMVGAAATLAGVPVFAK